MTALLDYSNEVRALGQRIRVIRTDAGRTLQGVASVAGISRSMLSQIERGEAQPSIHTLRGVANALGVPIASFFVEPEATRTNGTAGGRPSDQFVVRKAERKGLSVPDSKLRYELLVPGLDGALEVLWAEIPVGVTEPNDHPASHIGTECLVCFSGALVVRIEDATYELSDGDSITFDSLLPHSIQNPGDGPATFLTALTPPSF